MRRVLIISAVFGLALVGFLYWGGRALSQRPRVLLTFLGYTNASPGTATALFQISNGERSDMFYGTALPQFASTNGWRAISQADNMRFVFSGILTQQGRATFAVEVPGHSAIWRVPVMYGPSPWFSIATNVGQSSKPVSQERGVPQFQVIYSEAITN
jgi:hypothetical protein